MISGTTRVAGVIGDPVAHSLSPVLHNAAYEALDLDWVYVAFHVARGETAAALEAMRALDLGGLSVTMPHKTAAAAACDELTEIATTLQSVNTVTPLGAGRLRGDSTDGEGFLRALAAEGVDVAGSNALILGAGGAARAVAYALHDAGAHIIVSARRSEPAEELAALVDGNVVGWDARTDAAGVADVLVNATPIGMNDGDPNPLAPSAFRGDQVVADLVYHPTDTEFLHEARHVDARRIDGFAVLLQQAALQIEQWTGRAAPLLDMGNALRRATVPKR